MQQHDDWPSADQRRTRRTLRLTLLTIALCLLAGGGLLKSIPVAFTGALLLAVWTAVERERLNREREKRARARVRAPRSGWNS